MKQYLDLVHSVLAEGNHKPNRTGVDTVSTFGQYYELDLQEGFPLLTTKEMSGFRWNSLIHELLWYFSGEEHIRTLREHTGIWDDWADEEGHLDTAYGRFWRRYPVPEDGLPGESWPEDAHRWMNEDEGTFDQLQYVIDTLRENPHSRRLVVNAWHPGNAAVSTLPPCHYTFVFNVQGDELNCHLTQRSGDVALGIPFNIAGYAIITQIVAQRTDFEVGTFAHTIVDAHVYCGAGERGAWYADALPELQERLAGVDDPADYAAVREWVEANAPPEPAGEADADHVPGLLEQCTRQPGPRPELRIADKPIDELTFEDIELVDYAAEPGLHFAVAE